MKKFNNIIEIETDFPISKEGLARLKDIVIKHGTKEIVRQKNLYERQQERMKLDMLKSLAKTVTGAKIKELRLKMGLTQEQLGERLSLSKTAICQIEIRGRGQFQLNNLIRIMNVLDPNYFTNPQG